MVWYELLMMEARLVLHLFFYSFQNRHQRAPSILVGSLFVHQVPHKGRSRCSLYNEFLCE